MPRLAQGLVTLDGDALTVVSMTVEAPQAEIANMTSLTDSLKFKRLIRTGDYTTPGRISMELFSAEDPAAKSGYSGPAVFSASSTPTLTITKHVIVDSVSLDARIGDVYRSRMTMTVTDYTDDNGPM